MIVESNRFTDACGKTKFTNVGAENQYKNDKRRLKKRQ